LSNHNANLVIPTARPVDSQIKSLDHVAATGLDAIIYLGVFEPQALRRMVENGPPAVLVDYSIRGLQIDSILLDNRGGGCQAMEHLLSLGHRKLAVIVGAEDQTQPKSAWKARWMPWTRREFPARSCGSMSATSSARERLPGDGRDSQVG
jgi:DNA-binding LacI/PurR family transcriptional regulator